MDDGLLQWTKSSSKNQISPKMECETHTLTNAYRQKRNCVRWKCGVSVPFVWPASIGDSDLWIVIEKSSAKLFDSG